MTAAGPPTPYRFLNPYGADDVAFFFGRDRETRTLLSDVLVSRIVVLFAKTGTGKSSLINAGVRPQLEQRGYRTFVVRVMQDPIRSAREELAEARDVPRLPRRSLSDQLAWVSRRLASPIVVFFDQFEEFFVYLMRRSPDRARRFIEEVAKTRGSRDVHLAFSMREEFFVEMDAFRDEIPTIFHNDSNLRLRWFEPEQAEEAIVKPALAAGGKVDDGLAGRIIDGLSEDGRVEPARLQIVCHTLWREGRRRLRVDDYDRLGGAAHIVTRRLEEDVAHLEDDQLRLFERLVPELRTEYGTKYLRGVDELAGRLGAGDGELGELLERLTKANLLSETAIHRERYVEWTSDYLAERSGYLATRARATLHRNILAAALRAAGRRRNDLTSASLGWSPDTESPTREDFERMSREAGELAGLPRDGAAFAFGRALALGVQARTWFSEAQDRGVDVWGILEHVVRDRSVEAPVANAIGLLADLADPRTGMRILEATLDDPELAETALDALARMRNAWAIRVLERRIKNDAWAGPAIDALRRMRTAASVDALARAMRRGGVTGLRAGIALNTLVESSRARPDKRSRDALADHAAAAMSSVLDAEAAALFTASLASGIQPPFWFDQARRRGADVWGVLHDSVADPAVPAERATGAVDWLRDSEEPQADRLLELATRQQRLRASAEAAIEERRRRRGDVPERRPAPKPPSRWHHPELWGMLVDRIRAKRCLPVIGAGINARTLPLGSEIASRWATRYDYPFDDANDLARVAQYITVEYDPMFAKELLVQTLGGGTSDAAPMPTAAHGVLARLDLPVYVTATYDDLMTQALRQQGKRPRTEICRWNDSPSVRGAAIDADTPPPTPGEPIVFHLYGHIAAPESLVLTQDDELDFLTAFGRGKLLPPWVAKAWMQSMLLFVGLGPENQLLDVIDRSMARSLRRVGLAVHLAAFDERTRVYIERRYNRMNMSVYWGTTDEFTAELDARLAS